MKVPKPRKLKNGSYFIQLRLNGVSVPVSAATAKECTRQAQLIKAEHLAQRRIIAPASDLTLDTILKNYIAHYETVLSPSTIRGYDRIRCARFKGYMQKSVGSIKDWQLMINEEAAVCSAKTLKNAWAFVRRALKKEAGITLGADAVHLPQVPVKEIPFLQPEELFAFCDALRGNVAETAALLELHGLRLSEVLGLDWKDIDLKRGSIRVHSSVVRGKDGSLVKKETNKNKSSTRTVPIMIPQLTALLGAVKDKTGPVVSVPPSTMLNNVKACCMSAGVTVVGNHGLRHSFASLAYHLGISERQLMELGGWADYNTMHKIYIRLSSADEKAAQNAISDFFAARFGSENANGNANGNSKPA